MAARVGRVNYASAPNFPAVGRPNLKHGVLQHALAKPERFAIEANYERIVDEDSATAAGFTKPGNKPIRVTMFRRTIWLQSTGCWVNARKHCHSFNEAYS